MVGGAALGLDLAEELGRLAPFGMGNPGVRLLVPSARVSDVRTMGEGKHSRFSLHSGSHRALGVAFGRPRLGVGEDDLVDVAVRLEVNHWNGAVEPRVVLRELYRREAARKEGAARLQEWWARFEAELGRDPGDCARRPVSPPAVSARASPSADQRQCPGRGARRACLLGGPAACLALVADARACAPRWRGRGLRLADYAELERTPARRGFDHVVLVDPPPCRRAGAACRSGGAAGRPAAPGLGGGGVAFRAQPLDAQLARRAGLGRGLPRAAGGRRGER